MTSEIRSDEIDEDALTIIESFAHIEGGKSAIDYVSVEDGQLQFSKKTTLDIQEKKLNVFPGYEIFTDGGAGIVFHCKDDEFQREYALKVPRLSNLLDDEGEESIQKMKEELKENRAEAMKQGRLTHDNVAYLVWAVDMPLPTPVLEPRGPVMLQEWIEEAKPLDKFIESDECTRIETLIRTFRDVFRGLDHIHDKNLVHWDVKEDNCLVDSSGKVKITDVGNAHEKQPEEGIHGEPTERYTSKKCWPTDSSGFDEYQGSNRIRVEFGEGDRSYDRPWLDLYMAGRMMARISGFEITSGAVKDPKIPDVLAGDEDEILMTYDFLRVIIRRLLKPLEDGRTDSPKFYYESAEEVAKDLEKLLHKFGDSKEIPELYPVPQNIIRMPVTGNTVFTPRLQRLTNIRPAINLQRHQQLGLTKFVYPGGRHSRYEHMLGAIGVTLDYIRALYSDQTSPAFRLLCDSIHIRALIFAVAIHDMGHGAFSHYLEENQAIFNNCNHENYIKAVLLDNPGEYCEGALPKSPRNEFLPEENTIEDIIVEDWLLDDRLDEERENVDYFLQLVYDIISFEGGNANFDPSLLNREDSETACRWILHSILDSALDADKTDYLRRDAQHAGLDYPEGADVDRFLQSLTVAVHEPDSGQIHSNPEDSEVFYPTIAINKKGVNSLESLLLARYQVFTSMYWHRIARSATVVLKRLSVLYIAPEETGYKERRAKLLQAFRKKEDEAAIRWLLESCRSSGTEVSRFENALLYREGLPKSIFDVGQGELQPFFQEDDRIRTRLEEIMEGYEKINSLEAPQYYRTIRKVRKRAWSKIKNRIRNHGDDSDTDMALDTISVDDIFIDIPVPGKDQISNIYVVDREDSLHNRETPDLTPYFAEDPESDKPLEFTHNVYPFQKFSKMGDDVEEAFENWARRIRVFLWEGHEEVLREVGGDEEILARYVLDSLYESFDEINHHSRKITEYE